MNTDNTRYRLTKIAARPGHAHNVADAILAEYVLIDRDELPEVERLDTNYQDGGYSVRINGFVYDAWPGSDYWARVLHSIAVALYADANPPVPPVDEADVQTLAVLLARKENNDDVDNLNYGGLARRLLATGRVKVVGGDE